MGTPLPASFEKSARLRAAPEFQAVFKQGLKYSGVFFRVYFLAKPPGMGARLGLAVPKKAVPLAHSRNRLKRLCREYFRQHSLKPSGDYVLVAQSRARSADNQAVIDELHSLFSAIKPSDSL